MKATDLQMRLAHLSLGETLLLPATEVEEAFRSFGTFEERRDAAVALAILYQCTLTVCEPAGSQFLFARHSGSGDGNSGTAA